MGIFRHFKCHFLAQSYFSVIAIHVQLRKHPEVATGDLL